MGLRFFVSLKWVLVALFMLHYMNNVFFTHVHVEGSHLVAHSHPYSNSHHQHSSIDFSLIKSLSLAVTIAFAMVFASIFRHLTRVLLVRYDVFNDTIFYNPLAPLRAPPSCS